MRIKELEEKIDRDILVLYNNLSYPEESIIDNDLVEHFYQLIQENKKHNHLRLMIQTSGGNLSSGARLVRILRQMYESYDSVVINRCNSTGTFVILGGEKVWLSPQSIITPTEPQYILSSGEKVSVSAMRNLLANLEQIKEIVAPVAWQDLGNYYATTQYFKNLCQQVYKNGDLVAAYMLNQVNSHQYPMSLSDFEACGIQAESLGFRDLSAYQYYHNQIINNQGNFLTRDKHIEVNTTILSGSETEYTYIKEYDQNKKLYQEGYQKTKK